ncbi:MAG: hypothetical protein U1F68_09325 [Gammaproteobacteria bacterium]
MKSKSNPTRLSRQALGMLIVAGGMLLMLAGVIVCVVALMS